MGDNAAAAAAAAAFVVQSTTSGGGNKKNKKNAKNAKFNSNNAAENGTSADLSVEAGSTTIDVPPKLDDGLHCTASTNTSADNDAALIMAQLGIGDTAGVMKDKKKGKGKKSGSKSGANSSAKPTNMAAKLALDRLAREKEESERAAKIEEEERLREEEENRAADEAERNLQIAKDRKKQLDNEKKERDRAAGKAVTKAEKAREAKAKAARDRLVASGLIKLDANGKVIQEKRLMKSEFSKKKKKSEDQNVKEDVEAVQHEKDETEKARLEAERLKEEARLATEESEKAREEARKAKEASALAILPDSWDDSGDDWDALPVIKLDEHSEEEEAVEEDEVYTKSDCPTFTNLQQKFSQKKKKGKKKFKAANRVSKVLGSNDSDFEDESHSESGCEDEAKEKARKLSAREKVKALQRLREKEIDRARERREERLKISLASRSKDELRSPICCVMGHVDTGKTKLLDKIRRTNVQEGEAGGITQQIGATYFPIENLKKITANLSERLKMDFKVPGLLVIDTPGHECFSNLRKRGSSTADVAILVVDIVHGLEPQTIESINLLRARNTQFVVALNKVDRLYGWKTMPGMPIRKALRDQDENVISEFETRVKFVNTQLMEQGLNSSLYYENNDFMNTLSIVPTSAHSGEGIPDLILLLVQLTQRMMVERLMFSEVPEATVLDVKKIEGVGTTMDVLLINGKIKIGDTIVVAGINGPITTSVRALLTPGEMKEMRVKSDYKHHSELKAAIGVKVVAQNLEDAIAGTMMMVVGEEDDQEELREAVMEDVADILKTVNTTGRGVCVQASTIGSLEALLEFLRVSCIPVAAVNIGPINKRDVARASIMLEHQKEFACILAFDVKVMRDASEYAEETGVTIFSADIVYHLFDKFTKYITDIKEQRRQEAVHEAVFPCILRIIPENVFMKKNPLVVGVEVIEGICRVGTPLVVPDKLIPDDDNPGRTKHLEIGRVESIEKDGVSTQTAKHGTAVCIKIQGNASQSYVTYGRHFDATNMLYSKVSRKSIDLLKEHFKDDLETADWKLVVKLKSVFDIA